MTGATPDMDLQSLILVVDDDPDLRKLITDFLAGHGYRVAAVENAAEMRRAIETQRPDLVILDVMMPGEDGLSAARRLAAENGPAVIMLSALGSDTDRIIGLEVGADDYLAKPCNPRELLARVRAVLRRRNSREPAAAASESAGGRFEFAGWRLDIVRRDLRDPTGTFINLSDGEFALLRSFVEHPQRVLSRDQLLDIARGRNAEVYDRAIDTQISRLRRKLNDRAQAELIRTVRNEGYMLLPKVTRL
jgi:two-component system, OmpR family, response regulator